MLRALWLLGKDAKGHVYRDASGYEIAVLDCANMVPARMTHVEGYKQKWRFSG